MATLWIFKPDPHKYYDMSFQTVAFEQKVLNPPKWDGNWELP